MTGRNKNFGELVIPHLSLTACLVPDDDFDYDEDEDKNGMRTRMTKTTTMKTMTSPGSWGGSSRSSGRRTW